MRKLIGREKQKHDVKRKGVGNLGKGINKDFFGVLEALV